MIKGRWRLVIRFVLLLGVTVAGVLGPFAAAVPAGAATAPINLYTFVPNGSVTPTLSQVLLAQSFTTGNAVTSLSNLGVWIHNNSGSTATVSVTLEGSSGGAPNPLQTLYSWNTPNAISAWDDNA
jgi:hypothetical protein